MHSWYVLCSSVAAAVVAVGGGVSLFVCLWECI